MRIFLLIFSLMWVATAMADGPVTASGPAPYQDAEHHFRITFPATWKLVKPNLSFTEVKARAPQGYAAINVASRDSLWRGDAASARYEDAWQALDGISPVTFTNRFERNVSTQRSTIFSVEKTTIGKEKAFKVDYVLSDLVKNASVRIRSFFVLRDHLWYSVSCATLQSKQDFLLDVMLKSVNTFEFY